MADTDTIPHAHRVLINARQNAKQKLNTSTQALKAAQSLVADRQAALDGAQAEHDELTSALTKLGYSDPPAPVPPKPVEPPAKS